MNKLMKSNFLLGFKMSSKSHNNQGTITLLKALKISLPTITTKVPVSITLISRRSLLTANKNTSSLVNNSSLESRIENYFLLRSISIKIAFKWKKKMSNHESLNNKKGIHFIKKQILMSISL